MSVVLYVEDHPPAQMLMKAIVGQMTNHRLSVAGSGEEARTIASDISPDLYILDLDLPDTDGISLASTLRSIHVAPVILVSAYAEAVKDSSLGSLIYTYLAKPLDPIDVAETIRRALA